MTAPAVSCPKRGFTLIELIVIIVIIATMASIVVPAYSRFLERTRFNGVVSDIVDLFADARERAIAKDTTVTVSFNPASMTFALDVQPPPRPRDLPVAFVQPDGEGDFLAKYSSGGKRGYQLREDFAIMGFVAGVGGNASRSRGEGVHFQNDGTCEGAKIGVASDKGYVAQITVQANTGNILVENQ